MLVFHNNEEFTDQLGDYQLIKYDFILDLVRALHYWGVYYCNVLGFYSRWNFIALQKSIHYS
jgi:hypothetical protein